MTKKEHNKQYNIAHPKRKRNRDPDKKRAADTRYRDNNRNKTRVSARKYYDSLSLEVKIFRRLKTCAKARNIEFTIKQLDIVIPDRCPVFGWTFVYGDRRKAVSVDRIDNSKGYVRGNIQFISRLANAMKNDASVKELKKFAEWINVSS